MPSGSSRFVAQTLLWNHSGSIVFQWLICTLRQLVIESTLDGKLKNCSRIVIVKFCSSTRSLSSRSISPLGSPYGYQGIFFSCGGDWQEYQGLEIISFPLGTLSLFLMGSIICQQWHMEPVNSLFSRRRTGKNTRC